MEGLIPCRIVLYQFNKDASCPAIVTTVAPWDLATALKATPKKKTDDPDPTDPGIIDVTAFPPGYLHPDAAVAVHSVPYDANGGAGTWRFPAR